MIKAIVTQSAHKQLKIIPFRQRHKIIRLIKSLETDPYLGKMLTGKLKGQFSLRVWPYRVIYTFDKKSKIIWILSILHRQGAYK